MMLALYPTFLFFPRLLLLIVLINHIGPNKRDGQFNIYIFYSPEMVASKKKYENERLLLWQSSGIFLYSTVIIFICFVVLENKI